MSASALPPGPVAARDTQELLWWIVRATSALVGEEFFRSLVQHLGQGLGLSVVFIAECVDEPASRVRTLACCSGLNAIALAILSVCGAGDHLLMVDSCYGPTRSTCDRTLSRYGIETTYYDPLIGARIAAKGQGTLGLTFLGTLALSLWGANAGTKAIFDALEDSDGRLWLATPAGLSVVRGKQLHTVVAGGPLLIDFGAAPFDLRREQMHRAEEVELLAVLLDRPKSRRCVGDKRGLSGDGEIARRVY